MDKEFNNGLFPEDNNNEEKEINTAPEAKELNEETTVKEETAEFESKDEGLAKAKDPDETVRANDPETTPGVRTTYVSGPAQMPPRQSTSYSYTNDEHRTALGNTAYPHTRSPYTASSEGTNPATGYSYPKSEASVPMKKKKKQKRITFGMVALMLVMSLVFSGIWTAAFYTVGNVINNISENGSIVSSKSEKEPNAPLNSSESKVVVDQNAEGIAAAVNVAADSVVEIKTETVSTSFFYGEYVQSGAGSGVITDAENGYIITCAHVIEGASTVTVTLRNGEGYNAEVIGSDTQTDIAVIKIDAENLVAAATYDSDKLVVGQTAIAIGNPLGTLGGSVSSGIVSALDRDITIDGQEYNLLQIDASINPGNSGGGLFDVAGNLIGIVNAKSGGSSGETTIEGLGFAIPINKALEVASDLVSQGYVGGRVYLGINVYEITDSTVQVDPALYDYIYGSGVYFVGYQEGQNGDFLYGDKIIAIDGNEVSTRAEILSLLNDYSVGDEVVVTVSRVNSDKGRRKMVEVDVTLIENVPEKEE